MRRRRHSRLPIFKLAAVAVAGFTTLTLAGMHTGASADVAAPPAPPAALAHIAELNRDAATSDSARRREEGIATVQAADAAADSHDRAVASRAAVARP